MSNYYILPEPAQVDYLNERSVILHFRALLDFHDLLLNGLEGELEKFRLKLLGFGWSRDKLHELLYIAASKTRYENLIPHPVRGMDKNRF